MKNKVIAFLLVCLFLLNSTTVLANTNSNIIVGTDEIEETIVERENYILDFVNNMLQTENIGDIESGDIDYNKALREFYIPNIFYDKKLSKDILKDYTKNMETVYSLPIYCNGRTVLLTLEIRKPLSDKDKEMWNDEQIGRLQEQVGKWYISVSEVRQNIVDYKSTIENALVKNKIENAEVYLVTGFCRHIDKIAVICSDVPDDTRILVLEQYGAETGTLEETFDYQVILEKDKLYTYEEIKAIVDADIEAQKDIPEDSVGGVGAPIQTSVDTAAPTSDNSKIIISAVSGVAVLAIAIAAVCIIKKKKNAKAIDEQ